MSLNRLLANQRAAKYHVTPKKQCVVSSRPIRRQHLEMCPSGMRSVKRVMQESRNIYHRGVTHDKKDDREGESRTAPKPVCDPCHASVTPIFGRKNRYKRTEVLTVSGHVEDRERWGSSLLA